MRGNFDRKDERERTRMEILSEYPRNGEGREGDLEMERGEKVI